jgi:hypothetical protein
MDDLKEAARQHLLLAIDDLEDEGFASLAALYEHCRKTGQTFDVDVGPSKSMWHCRCPVEYDDDPASLFPVELEFQDDPADEARLQRADEKRRRRLEKRRRLNAVCVTR